MPLRPDIRKVLVIGSGPIIIGQAAEFDYAGTQACQALREEGIQVVLVNSNPATIMTDANIADRVYIEPITLEFIVEIIEKERPDGVLPTLGGQVGLNMAVQLAESGVLERFGVRLLGTPLSAIKKAEDRRLFKMTMGEIGEPVPASAVVEALPEARAFAAKAGYPLIVRPAYTLGGTGGGIASNYEELEAILPRGLAVSMIHQVLLEQSVAGWKEIEYEVMRDGADNCITICNMENLDPVGVHTGDSIVIAPSQTLSDREYQMLRSASIRIIRSLGIEGGCNVQFALDPASMQYVVIEVNPRVSRSSALASKATGYPIAKVATKIAVGLALDEIPNAVTGKTSACFEPTLDYVVVKIPRWPFDKFTLADRRLGTQMKATGEVMAIGRSFLAALQKAIRSLEIGLSGLSLKDSATISDESLARKVQEPSDERLFAVAEALRRGWTVSRVAELTEVNAYYLEKIRELVEMEKELEGLTHNPDRASLLARAKELGTSDARIATLAGIAERDARALRESLDIRPSYKMVDTCAAEFEAATPYYYSTYESDDEAVQTDRPRPKVIVLGSGPIRIGQGIEFDYCSVHSVWALKDAGYEAIIVNNNPETVSTDFDTADRLYFEPLALEDVLSIIEREKCEGVVVQFGGQTAINLAIPLSKAGIKILGTSVEDIDAAEDRRRFDRLLAELGIPKPPGRTVTSTDEAVQIASEVGFPLLVRPSYVLGGRAMEIVYAESELVSYMASAVEVSPDHPVLVDKYIAGKEFEIDAVSDGEDVLIPGIMEHIERAGVHSGDSIAVYPSQTLTGDEIRTAVEHSVKLARALRVKGLLNLQFVASEGVVYVIEVNPRSSRTVPFLSKATGIPMVRLATDIMLGKRLAELGYGTGLAAESGLVAVKAPVFSFSKLHGVETGLGPEMKSTGEVMGVARSRSRALYKALLASGIAIAPGGRICATIADKDKAEAIPLLSRLSKLGFQLSATSGTAAALEAAGVKVERVRKLSEGSPNIVDGIVEGGYVLVINTLTRGKASERDGFRIRRAAVERGVACLTSLDTFAAVLDFLPLVAEHGETSVMALQDYDIRGVRRRANADG